MKTNLSGLVRGMVNDDYQTHSAVQSTTFKEFLKSAAHFQHMRTAQREEKEPFYFGQMFHSRTLEKKKIVACPKFDKRKPEEKAAEAAWIAANKDKLIYSWFDKAEANMAALEKIEGMARAVESHPTASDLLSEGEAEVSAFSMYQDVPVKARFDWLRPDPIIVDLKSTKCAHPDAFSKDIFNYGYHISAAWYSLVHYLVTGKAPEAFILIAVEKTAPYAVSVFRLKPEMIQLGHDLIATHLPRLKECLERNVWPAYPTEILDIGIPTWAENKTLAQLMEGEAV